MVAYLYCSIGKPIVLSPINLECFCNSFSYSWGANFDSRKIDGPWNKTEKALHINCEELLPAYYTLRSFIIYF